MAMLLLGSRPGRVWAGASLPVTGQPAPLALGGLQGQGPPRPPPVHLSRTHGQHVSCTDRSGAPWQCHGIDGTFGALGLGWPVTTAFGNLPHGKSEGICLSSGHVS